MRPRRVIIIVLAAALGAAGFFWWQQRQTPPLGEAAYARTAAILEHGPRPPGSAALDAVRAQLAADLEKAGWVTRRQAFERGTPVGQVRFENLRVRFPHGNGDPWERKVDGLLCAHVDSKFYKDIHFVGADDAASACAAVVEIGILLARRHPEKAGRMELVFFDGEEAFGENITPQDGLYGSRHYAGQWRARDDKPAFGILLDMIGHKDLRIALPSDTPDFLKESVMAAARAEKQAARFTMAPGPIIDDHVPLNFAGIPTVDIIGDFTRFRWWHTAADNLDIVSADSLDISMRVTLRVIDDMLAR
jgi:glutaminyl-peptide cyclotransferase